MEKNEKTRAGQRGGGGDFVFNAKDVRVYGDFVVPLQARMWLQLLPQPPPPPQASLGLAALVCPCWFLPWPMN
jgi:hypothetical protein